MKTVSPQGKRAAGRRLPLRRIFFPSFPAILALSALWCLTSCRSAPYDLGRRLEKLDASLAGLGGALGGEFRRAETLPAETTSFLQVVPFRGIRRGEAFLGGTVQGEFRRAAEGSRFLGKALAGELGRTESLEHPSPILWNYLGSEPARAAAALEGALWLWNKEWTDRLARDPWRTGVPGNPRGESPSLPKPLTLGEALLISLPIW